MAPGLTEQFMRTIQDVSDHVLDLVKTTGDLSTKVELCSRAIENLEIKQDELSRKNDKIVEILQRKMDPDRCAFLHEEVKTDIKRQLVFEAKRNVKGWGRTMLVILKVVAWLAIAFGGGTVGANALGLLKSINP